MRARSLPGSVLLCAAAIAWLAPIQAEPAFESDPMRPVAALPAAPTLHALTNSEAGAGRKWVRAVRDLAAERFDVDALPPRTPVDVWTVGDRVVAFSVRRAQEDGGTFRAIRDLVDDEPTWLSETGGTLTSALTTRPTLYRAISSNIGMREHPVRKKMKFHAGTDFAAAIGTPVVAIADGTVVKAAKSWTAGRYLVIKHDTGHETRLMHLDRKLKGIEEGVRVKKGQVVGLVGKTGRVTGPHLHFELRDARGTPLDAARVRWPADGAVTDARVRARIAHHFEVLMSLARVAPLELEDQTRAPAPLARDHEPTPASPVRGVPPVVPVRSEVARARVTPPLPRKRRALPPGASLFDDLDEAQLDDPLVRRALLLAAEFS